MQIQAVLTAAGEPTRSPAPGRLIARYPVLLADEPVGTVSVEHVDDDWAPTADERRSHSTIAGSQICWRERERV
jgi:hypothetical protein